MHPGSVVAACMITVAAMLSGSAQGAMPDPVRGRLLYENYCYTCHESRLHIREHREVRSPEQLRRTIDVWQHELNLDWSEQDILDVMEYLIQTFYRFPGSVRPPRGAVEHDAAPPRS